MCAFTMSPQASCLLQLSSPALHAWCEQGDPRRATRPLFPKPASGSRWLGSDPLKLSASARPRKRLPVPQILLPRAKARRKPLQHTTPCFLSSPEHTRRDGSSLMVCPKNPRPHQQTCRPLMCTQIRVLWWAACQPYWMKMMRSPWRRDWRQLVTSTGKHPADNTPAAVKGGPLPGLLSAGLGKPATPC